MLFYYILWTFIGFPLIAAIISQYVTVKFSSKLTRFIIASFILHNLIFLLGYSLRGDYPDYTIFSLEYFFLCWAIFSLHKFTNIYIKIIRITGIVAMSIGVLVISLGILVVMFISSDYEADKIIHFKSANYNFETREYRLGGATSSDTKYIFQTFRVFKYLPIEHEIDKTEFHDSKINLNFLDPEFRINIIKKKAVEKIIFSSAYGKKFEKIIN